jgi:hypothetical protein
VPRSSDKVLRFRPNCLPSAWPMLRRRC